MWCSRMLLELVLPALAGAGLGVVAGLTPGLHANTLAVLLLGAIGGAGLEMACLLVAMAVAQTVSGFLPATFLGAPDPEGAATALPAHALLQEGRGYEAAMLALHGCTLGFGISLLLLLPAQALLAGASGTGALDRAVPGLIVVLAAVLVLTERQRLMGRRSLGMLAAGGVFVLAGWLGSVVLSLPIPSSLGEGQGLFALLAGLFGMPGLLLAARSRATRRQQLIPASERTRESVASAGVGAAFGSVVGILPGMTSGVATVLALLTQRTERREQAIVATAAAAMAASLFTVFAFLLISRARSGVMLAIEQRLPSESWTTAVPLLLPPFLLAALLGLALAAACHPVLAAGFARGLGGGQRRVNVIVGGLVASLVAILSGPLGLGVLLAATLVGLIPWRLGVRRTHLMGCLLVPLLAA